MIKKLILAIAVMAVMVGAYSVSYAAENAEKEPIENAQQEKEREVKNLEKEGMEQIRKEEIGKIQDKGKWAKHHPNKEEMEAKKIEIEKRLNLTDSQKKKIESYKEKDREKIKPIIEKIKTNREEMRKVKFDPTISRSEKEKKIEKLQKERKSLKEKANKCREENMKNFESVLTPEQKEEFEKIKAEQRKQMEERRKEFVKKNDRKPPIHQEVMPLK